MNFMSKNNDRTIEEILNLMQRDDSVDAPADSIQWAKNLFRARVAAPKKSLTQKVLAVLQMDLAPNRTVFGERSATSPAVRQMLFEAGENSLDLRISQTKKGLNLRGQILGEGFANCAIKLTARSISFEARANELSEFNFAEIPAGKYDLILQNDENEIVVAGIDL